jgi:hypothetical protein
VATPAAQIATGQSAQSGLGFRAALAKPFELEQLAAALARVLVPSP